MNKEKKKKETSYRHKTRKGGWLIFITRKKPRTMCPEFIKEIIKACSITTTPLLRVSANYHWTINNRWLPLTVASACSQIQTIPQLREIISFSSSTRALSALLLFPLSRAKLGGKKRENVFEAISSLTKQFVN